MPADASLRRAFFFGVLAVTGLLGLGCGDDGGRSSSDTATVGDADVGGSDTSAGVDTLTADTPTDTGAEDTSPVDTTPGSCVGQKRCNTGGNVESCLEGEIWAQTRSCPLGCADGRCNVPTDPGACGAPHTLTLGAPVTGSTETPHALYRWPASCTSSYGYAPTGSETVYQLDLGNPTTVRFTVTPLDPSFYGLHVRGVCDDDSSAYWSACEGNDTETSGYQLTTRLPPGPSFVIVDDFGADGLGPGQFQLLAEQVTTAQCHGQLPEYIDLSSGSATVYGDTSLGQQQTSWLEYNCPQDGFQSLGSELIYEFVLREPATVRASVTPQEPADSEVGIYIRSVCNDRFRQEACGYTAGNTPGTAEADLQAGVWYLIVDDFSSSRDSAQTFLLEVQTL